MSKILDVEPNCCICGAKSINHHGKVILPRNEREEKFVCGGCCETLKQLPMLTVENEKIKG